MLLQSDAAALCSARLSFASHHTRGSCTVMMVQNCLPPLTTCYVRHLFNTSLKSRVCLSGPQKQSEAHQLHVYCNGLQLHVYCNGLQLHVYCNPHCTQLPYWRDNPSCLQRRHYTRSCINHLKTKRRPLYLKTQSVPRSKHFSSRL
jgi:hypothetical protein